MENSEKGVVLLATTRVSSARREVPDVWDTNPVTFASAGGWAEGSLRNVLDRLGGQLHFLVARDDACAETVTVGASYAYSSLSSKLKFVVFDDGA